MDDLTCKATIVGMLIKSPIIRTAALMSSLFLAILYLLVQKGYVSTHFGGTKASFQRVDKSRERNPKSLPSATANAAETTTVSREAQPPSQSSSTLHRDTLMMGTKSTFGAVTVTDGTLQLNSEARIPSPPVQFRSPDVPRANLPPSYNAPPPMPMQQTEPGFNLPRQPSAKP